MKTFYSAQDIENLAAMGQRELVIDENTVLTDLAREAASQLGVKLVSASRPSLDQAPRPAAHVLAAPAVALGARPKGCQHGPLPGNPMSEARDRQAGPRTGGSNALVDQLVGVVKQLSGGRPRS